MNDDFVKAEPTPAAVPSPRPNVVEALDIVEALKEIDQRFAFKRPSSAVDLAVLRGEDPRKTTPRAAFWAFAAAVVLSFVALSGDETVAPAMSGNMGSQVGVDEELPGSDSEIELPSQDPQPRMAPIDSRRDDAGDQRIENDSADRGPRIYSPLPDDGEPLQSPRAVRSKPRWRSAPVRGAPAVNSGERDGQERKLPTTSPSAGPNITYPKPQKAPLSRQPSSKSVTPGSNDLGDSNTGSSDRSTNDVDPGEESTGNGDLGPTNDPATEKTAAERDTGGCEGRDGPGLYVGQFCPLDAPFAVTTNMSCERALADCEGKAAANPSQNITCLWNGETIFSREMTPACDDGSAVCAGLDGLGSYRGYLCEGGLISTEDISCKDAWANCVLNASVNPTLSITCTWNGVHLFTREVTVGICEDVEEP